LFDETKRREEAEKVAAEMKKAEQRASERSEVVDRIAGLPSVDEVCAGPNLAHADTLSHINTTTSHHRKRIRRRH
jgi:hypothetical protein